MRLISLLVLIVLDPGLGFSVGPREDFAAREDNKLEGLVEQILVEMNSNFDVPDDDEARSIHDEDMEELLEEIFNPDSDSGITSGVPRGDKFEVTTDENDLELLNALNSLDSLLSMSHSSRRRRSVAQDQLLLEAMANIESLLLSQNNRTRRSASEANRSQAPSTDMETDTSDSLINALGSLESLMRTTSPSSRKRRSLVESEGWSLSEEVLEVYHILNKAEMKVKHDSHSAMKLIEKAKTKLKVIAKTQRESGGCDTIKKVLRKRSTEQSKVMVEEGPIEAMTRKMVARGYNSQEYHWLAKEFDLTKQDVDEVKNMSDEEFFKFSRSLRSAQLGSEDDPYSVDDLIEVFRSARQLVPVELEAAAHGVVHVGRHLSGRAR